MNLICQSCFGAFKSLWRKFNRAGAHSYYCDNCVGKFVNKRQPFEQQFSIVEITGEDCE